MVEQRSIRKITATGRSPSIGSNKKQNQGPTPQSMKKTVEQSGKISQQEVQNESAPRLFPSRTASIIIGRLGNPRTDEHRHSGNVPEDAPTQRYYDSRGNHGRQWNKINAGAGDTTTSNRFTTDELTSKKGKRTSTTTRH
jgi:hypothetical protein